MPDLQPCSLRPFDVVADSGQLHYLCVAGTASGHFVREKRDCHELRLVKRFFDSLFIFTEQAGRGKAGVFGRREDRGSFRLISVGHGYHFRPRQEKAGGFGNCFPDSRSLCAWRQYRAVKNDRGTHL